MSETTRIEIIKVSEGERIVSAEVLDDGTCKLSIKTNAKKKNHRAVTKKKDKSIVDKEIFELVEASGLTWKDEFMNFEPRNLDEERFKKLLKDAIKTGLKDFYRPRLDPSFDEKEEICYKLGEKPAVCKSYNWWQKKAKEFCPERGSRLGTKTEYVAFLGVLIKKLVDSGWNVQDAWRAVCYDSKELGHYSNSENAKHDFEATGSREVCGFFDLANTFKILANDKGDGYFWQTGGCCKFNSCVFPLVDLVRRNNRDDNEYFCVGWLVLEK